MRLFSTKKVREEKKVSNDAELYEAHTTRKILEKEVVKLQEFKDSIEPKKRKEIEAFSAYMQKMQSDKSLILKDIKELKKQRDKVMAPLDNRKMELMEFEEELDKKNKRLTFKNEELSREKLEVTDRKNLVNEKQDKVIRAEKEVLDNQGDIKRRYELLEDKESIYDVRALKLSRYDKKLKEHTLDLENREEALKLKFEAFKHKEDEVNKQLKIIGSRQAQLKSAYQELKNNGK